MGQVPSEAVRKHAAQAAKRTVKILVVGDGRLASALIATLREQARQSPGTDTDSYTQWSRRAPSTGISTRANSFSDAVSSFQPTHIWLAISDRAIEAFAREHAAALSGRTLVHFAGSLSSFDVSGAAGTTRVHSAHPLSTFAAASSSSLIAPGDFTKIPFILDQDSPPLEDLLPGFENPSHRLAPQDRAYYHALCAISGNFTTLLWETVADRFENELHIPREALTPYREQIFANLAQAAAGTSVLTGPLVRGDTSTLESHARALTAHYENPLLKIYDGFTDLFRTESQKKRGSL